MPRKDLESLTCAPDAQSARAELAAIVEGLLLDQVKLLAANPLDAFWYVFGGSSSPREGLDCSGLPIWCCRQLTTPLLVGRPDTDAMWRGLEKVATPEPGDLALYGRGIVADPASHVMVCLEGGRVAGMSGGGSHVTSIAIAKVKGARLQERSSHLYRADFIGFRRIPFERSTP
jgi:hypothetical protein